MTMNEYLWRSDAKGYLRVLEVLREWDPIGVIGYGPQDEYDSYAPTIIRMLDAGNGVDDLTKHMVRIVAEHMGISVDKKKTRQCAQKLVDFWQEWKPLA